MKKILLFALMLTTLGLLSSCKTKKEGCENTEAYKPPVDKNGNLSTKRGTSSLWDKKKAKKKKR